MAEHTIEVADIKGKKTPYARGGSGEPLIYLHSALGETSLFGTPWLGFVDKLADDFDVISTVHPGFGDAEGISEIDDIIDLVFHYLDFMDALGLESAHFVGHSLGGWLAAELAAFYPDRVRRLVLSAAVGIWLDDDPIAEIFGVQPAEYAELLFADPQSHPLGQALLATDGMRDTGLPRDADPESLLPAMRALSATARVGWNPYLHDPKLAHRLHRVTAPTLVLWGARDSLISDAYADEWARLIPDATLRRLSEIGHMPQLEAEDEWVGAIAEFLSAR